MPSSSVPERLRDCAWVLREILGDFRAAVGPGVSTGALDRVASKLMETYGVRSAFRGYRGFPATLTASVNEEVIDGLPGARILAEGDLLKVQVGIESDGVFAYAAETHAIGTVPEAARRLVEAGREALKRAMAQAVASRTVEGITRAIETALTEAGASPIRDYCGHGIGEQLHQEPQIPCALRGPGTLGHILRAGETLAIQVLATDRPARLRQGTGLAVMTHPPVHSVHWGGLVTVGPSPEILLMPGPATV